MSETSQMPSSGNEFETFECIADAKFWVGRGQKPTVSGIRIPDENGRETPLRKYDQKTIVLTLPGDLTVFDIGNDFFIIIIFSIQIRPQSSLLRN